MQKKITFAAGSAMIAALEGFTKLRIETRDSGVMRLKPTNRVVSKDLAPLLYNKDGSISAIIPQRYFEQAIKQGNLTFDQATAPTDDDQSPSMTIGLEKQAHGWLAMCSNGTMELNGQLKNHIEEQTEAPAGAETAPAGQ